MNQLPYKDATSMWRALMDRVKAASKESGIPHDELLRRFIFERFLARVFHDPVQPWVLKGGTAVLARVNDARHSKDVDLLHQMTSVTDALTALRAACEIDLGDHFRFIITSTRAAPGGTAQPDVEGSRVQITAYCGVTSRTEFGVDLVAGSLMTAPPETHPASTPVTMPGLSRPDLRLYPLVDHIADKLCATEALYSNGRRSSRVRDLVDLVVFARTQVVPGGPLADAIHAERIHRGLPARLDLDVPDAWRATYPGLARKTPRCADHADLESATQLVAQFLEPAMRDQVRGWTWHPSQGQWIEAMKGDVISF